MDDIIPILFALLVFVGPLLLKFLGTIFENATSSSSNSGRMTPEQRRALQQRARQLAAQQEVAPVEAEVIDEKRHSVFDGRSSSYNDSADSIEQRDDRMDRHLEQTFEHRVGKLSHDEVTHVEQDVLHTEELQEIPRENLAAGIAAMMKNRNDIRKAFILGEILQRPS